MRIALRAALLAGVAAVLVAPSALAQAPAGEPQKRPGEWGQAVSDLKPEAGLRFGRLPNGMRYVIKHNSTPSGQASLRLRIGAGSLEERDDQQGLAHFLEHMAFKGSTHVPAGDLIQRLQRLGLSFGADTNAATSFDETVFQFDLPHGDPASLETGVGLLREIGGELLLRQDAMDPERGVVLSEERVSDSPGYRATKAQYGFLLEGQRAPTRWPIGQVDILKTAPVSRIRDFYEAWYRPENATLVAVGDFDLDYMEGLIRQRFADWRGKGTMPAYPDIGQVERRLESTSLYVEAGGPQQLQVAWAQPYDATADTFARERRDTIEQLGLAVLNRRLERLSHAGDPPFLSASAGRDNLIRSAKVTTLFVRTTPQAWSRGLRAAVEEQRRLLQFGVRPDELAREITEYRTRLGAEATAADTRTSPAIAQSLAETVNDDEVFTGPVQNAANFERFVAALTPAQVDAALRAAFAGSGPLLTMASPQEVAGGREALKTALDGALAAPLTAAAAQASAAWPYTSFGAPGRVTARQALPDLGLTLVTFANGVRLTVKPTRFTQDQILVSVRVGDGRVGLPRDRATPVWATGAFVQGGTRELAFEDIDRIAADKVAGVGLSLDDDAYALQGATRPKDLAFEMQLATAYLTRPGFRPEAFDRTRAQIATVLPQVDSTPSGVLARDLAALEHGGDVRWRTLPTAAELAASSPAEWAARLGPELAQGPLDVTVVGDVTPEQAIAAVASTLGALPARAAAPKPSAAALAVRFPAGGAPTRVETHAGRADQAVAFVGWPAADFFTDPTEARAMGVATDVFENRLIAQVRVAEGASYSPGAEADPSDVFPGYGYVAAEVETPPFKTDRFFANARKIVADLRAAPVGDDELERSKRPRVETRRKQMETNTWWLAVLGRVRVEPRQLDAVRTAVSGIEAVTAADVQRVAQRYLTDDKAWTLVVRSPHPAAADPADKAVPVGAGPARPPAPGQPTAASPPPGAQTTNPSAATAPSPRG